MTLNYKPFDGPLPIKKSFSFKHLRFAFPYKKLICPIFSTIRLTQKFNLGELVRVIVKEREIEDARIVGVSKMALKDIPADFLMYDTQTYNLQEAISKIRSFYVQEIKKGDILTIYFLYWIKMPKKFFSGD